MYVHAVCLFDPTDNLALRSQALMPKGSGFGAIRNKRPGFAMFRAVPVPAAALTVPPGELGAIHVASSGRHFGVRATGAGYQHR
jgi:hypothetical protein